MVFEPQACWRKPRRKEQKAPERHAVRRVCPCQSMVSFPPILVTRQVFGQAEPCAAWRHRALLIQGAAFLRGKGGQSRPPLRALSLRGVPQGHLLRGAQRRGNPFPARQRRADGTSGTPSPTPVIRTPACHSEPVRAAKQVPLGYTLARESAFPCAVRPCHFFLGYGVFSSVRPSR